MAISSTDRKRAQRAKEQTTFARLGGRRLSFVVYGATLAKLEAICEAEGFTGKQRLGEALTHLIDSHKL